MKKLKIAFKTAGTKSKAEKCLVRIIHEPLTELVLDTQLKGFMETLQVCKGSIDELELYDSLLNIIRESKSRSEVLKALFVAHNVINTIGETFKKVFLQEIFSNALSNSSRVVLTDEKLQGAFANKYYIYLMLYSSYNDDINSFMNVSSKSVVESIKSDDCTHIAQLLTFKNILRFFATHKESFGKLLEGQKPTKTTERIFVHLLTEVFKIYNMVVKHLRIVIKSIYDVNKDMALLIDELYSDTIQITKNLETFIDRLPFEICKQMPKLDSFMFDSDFNNKEEQYILSIKQHRHMDTSKEESFASLDVLKYQYFRVAKKEFLLNSDVWKIERLLVLEGKTSKLAISSSPISMNFELKDFNSVQSFKKAYTTPMGTMSHKNGLRDDYLNYPQEIQSARGFHTMPSENIFDEPQKSVVLDSSPEKHRRMLTNSDYFPNPLPLQLATNQLDRPSTSSTSSAITPINNSKRAFFSGLLNRSGTSKSGRQIIPLGKPIC